jgi:hypothetical protein
MTFETIVDDLVALFDVTQAKAVAVVNDRLQDMVARSTALRALKSLGTTVAGQASYSLDATVVQVHKVYIVNGTETTLYEGSATLEDFIDLTAAAADTCGNWYVTEPDTDSSALTENLRLYPAPDTGGLTITGLVAIRPATLTYATATALPVPADVHDSLKEGAKAVLYAEEGRQDEAAPSVVQYETGIVDLRKGVEKRGKGTGSHRMRHTNYF